MKQKQLSLTFGILVVTAIAVGVAILIWLRTISPQASPSLAKPTQTPSGVIGAPTVRPNFVVATEATPVTVEIQITDSSYVSGSANLERVDATGKVISTLGALHDNGLAGDIAGGDKVFAILTTLNEATHGQVRLQVSADFRGLTKKVSSGVITVRVNPFNDPEQTLNQLAKDLRTGNLISAAQKMESRYARALPTLNQATLNRLADLLATRRFLRETDNHNFRIYTGSSTDEAGAPTDADFMIARDQLGQWRIAGW